MGRKKGVAEFEESPPDDFDPADPYKDPVAMLEMREHIVREKWIDIERSKILRERLRWCYRVEGVNHLQKCRHLVQQYLDSTRGIGWGKDHRPPCLHGVRRWKRKRPRPNEKGGGLVCVISCSVVDEDVEVDS
ncbi:NADH dehydrogenase [ubiquinone] 1 beta subcomplex subunit 10-B [Linum perenne]